VIFFKSFTFFESLLQDNTDGQDNVEKQIVGIFSEKNRNAWTGHSLNSLDEVNNYVTEKGKETRIYRI